MKGLKDKFDEWITNVKSMIAKSDSIKKEATVVTKETKMLAQKYSRKVFPYPNTMGPLSIIEIARSVQNLRNPSPKLANIGSTCYGNTILQILYHTRSFYDIMIKKNQPDNQFYILFQRLLHNMAENDPADNRRSLLRPVFQYVETKNSSFVLGKPNDSYMFFLNVLNLLSAPSKNPFEEVDFCQLFEGLVQKRWVCKRCKGVSIDLEDNLPGLDVEPSLYKSPNNTKNLFEYDRDEEHCDKCGKETTHSLILTLVRAPKILVIRMKTTEPPNRMIHDRLEMIENNNKRIMYEFYAGNIDSSWGEHGGHSSAIIKNTKCQDNKKKYRILSDSDVENVDSVRQYPKILFYQRVL